jgi:hypothetical protein
MPAILIRHFWQQLLAMSERCRPRDRPTFGGIATEFFDSFQAKFLLINNFRDPSLVQPKLFTKAKRKGPPPCLPLSHAGLRPNQAAKTQMTVVTTIATNDNDVEEDGCMRLP